MSLSSAPFFGAAGLRTIVEFVAEGIAAHGDGGGSDPDLLTWVHDSAGKRVLQSPPLMLEVDSGAHAGFSYRVVVLFGERYPSKPPQVKIERCWHPNVSPDTGYTCIEGWKPPGMTLSGIMQFLQHLLLEPGLDSPLNAEAAQQCRDDQPAYALAVLRFRGTAGAGDNHEPAGGGGEGSGSAGVHVAAAAPAPPPGQQLGLVAPPGLVAQEPEGSGGSSAVRVAPAAVGAGGNGGGSVAARALAVRAADTATTEQLVVGSVVGPRTDSLRGFYAVLSARLHCNCCCLCGESLQEGSTRAGSISGYAGAKLPAVKLCNNESCRCSKCGGTHRPEGDTRGGSCIVAPVMCDTPLLLACAGDGGGAGEGGGTPVLGVCGICSTNISVGQGVTACPGGCGFHSECAEAFGPGIYEACPLCYGRHRSGASEQSHQLQMRGTITKGATLSYPEVIRLTPGLRRESNSSALTLGGSAASGDAFPVELADRVATFHMHRARESHWVAFKHSACAIAAYVAAFCSQANATKRGIKLLYDEVVGQRLGYQGVVVTRFEAWWRRHAAAVRSLAPDGAATEIADRRTNCAQFASRMGLTRRFARLAVYMVHVQIIRLWRRRNGMSALSLGVPAIVASAAVDQYGEDPTALQERYATHWRDELEKLVEKCAPVQDAKRQRDRQRKKRRVAPQAAGPAAAASAVAATPALHGSESSSGEPGAPPEELSPAAAPQPATAGAAPGSAASAA